MEPALANKFETIGSGVTGSAKIKIEYLKVFLYAVSAVMLVASLLSVMTREKDSQSLNYTMWKPSSILFLIISLASCAFAFYL
jgi:hypothetical protein